MRVEVECSTSDQNTQTALNQPAPKEIAQVIKEQVTKRKQTDKRNPDSFSNRTNITEQGTSTSVHNYQNNRPRNDHHSPPLPNYPPPVRPPPPSDNEHELPQYHVHQRISHRYRSHIRPNNLRFPYAVTPRSDSRKSFFHQSTNEQSPTATVMETIWFQDKDPRTLNTEL